MAHALATITAHVGRVTIGANFASFGMAVQYFKDGPVNWLKVVAFRPQLLQVIQKNVPKGRFIQVIAHPEVRTWLKDDVRASEVVFVCHQVVLFPKNTVPIAPPPVDTPELGTLDPDELADAGCSDEFEPGDEIS